MNLLIITGKLVPSLGNNVLILRSVLPFLTGEHQVRLLSETDLDKDSRVFPAAVYGCPVHWAFHRKDSFRTRVIFPLRASLADRNVCSDAIQVLHAADLGKAIRREYPYDAILSTMEPFYAAVTASMLPAKKRILYLMDPPISFVRDIATPYRTRKMESVLAKHDLILTTPFVRDAFAQHGYQKYLHKFAAVGFPKITAEPASGTGPADGRIRLLFCGWLYSTIRSPGYFLDILSRLDERFVVTFMGQECEKLTERFDIHTKAELITLPQQPYETALQAMAEADILINIGNSVPVHMPSKTLEYINTGKPFVNFYKLDDCPTLYYTKRYPLCMNMSEKDTDLDAAARRFIDFCVENKGKTVDRDYIEREYEDCTPQYIAQKILDALGE